MTEIAFINTKEGQHITAKQIGIKAWALGCSCCECNREFEKDTKMTNHICNCANRPKEAIALCTNCGGDIVRKPDVIKAAMSSVGSMSDFDRARIGYDKMNVYEREIWNKAIEAAALIVQPNPHVDEERQCQDIANQLRKLKK